MRDLFILLIYMVAPFNPFLSGVLFSIYYIVNFKNESEFPYSMKIDWTLFTTWLLIAVLVILSITGPKLPYRKELLLMMILFLGSYKAGRVFFDRGGDHYELVRTLRDVFIVISPLIIAKSIALTLEWRYPFLKILRNIPAFNLLIFEAIFLPIVILPCGNKNKRLVSYILSLLALISFVVVQGRGLILTLFIIALWASLITSGRGTLGFAILTILAALKHMLQKQTLSVEFFGESAPFFVAALVIAMSFAISHSRSKNPLSNAVKATLTTLLFTLATITSLDCSVWKGNHWFLLPIAFAMSIAKELEESIE